MPEFSNIKLTVLSPTEIRKKANKEGDRLYLKFRESGINKWNTRLSLDKSVMILDFNENILIVCEELKYFLDSNGLSEEMLFLFF